MSETMGASDVVDERIRDQRIVDTDFHLEIRTEHLHEYVESDVVLDKLTEVGPPSLTRIKPGLNMRYASEEPELSKYHGEALESAEIKEVMTDFGIDAGIVTPPNVLPFHLTNYPKISTELARAYNDYVLENVVDVDREVYANMVVPYWEPEVAAEEIHRVGSEDGIVGGFNYVASKLWGRAQLDPIYEAMTEYDLPLVLHIGSLNVGDLVDDQVRTWLETSFTGPASYTFANVTNMIFNGVFDSYPDLEVVWQEVGNQWIPYAANRLDDQYQLHPKDIRLSPRKFEAGEEYLERQPSEYIYDNMYVTTQPIALPKRSDEAAAILLACHASETFVFASDWPHLSTDATNWLFEQPGLDDDLRDRICRGNVEDAFDLPGAN